METKLLLSRTRWFWGRGKVREVWVVVVDGGAEEWCVEFVDKESATANRAARRVSSINEKELDMRIKIPVAQFWA